MKRTRLSLGSFYIEAMVAIAMIGLISTSMLPVLPQLIRQTNSLSIHTDLVIIADYIGNYLFRWAEYPADIKPFPFSYYIAADGTEFDVSGEKRVNSLIWAEDLMSDTDYISDHYKTSITFWDTADRLKSAVVKVVVWYDDNSNFTLDEDENSYQFSTVLTEYD